MNPCTIPSILLKKFRSKNKSTSPRANNSSNGKAKMTRNDIPPPSYTEAAGNGTGALANDLSITLEGAGRSLLVTVTPPSSTSIDEKKQSNNRAPLDLVAVIDVSGSMSASAPAYTEQGKPKEDTGLSVLDVVKHAMKTIIATMEDNDRLAIVAFDNVAEVISNFVSTTNAGKAQLNTSVEAMYPKSTTNLWDGLRTGMNLLAELQSSSSEGSGSSGAPSERLSSVFILTDGQPNVEPPRGHIPMLEQYLESHPDVRFNISTFGFGYNLDSGLLSDIARVGAGGFGFIPDAGMVGTVFVHAVSNLYSTYATRCYLNVEIPEDLGVTLKQPKGGFPLITASWGAKVEFGDLQYGQTRELVLEFEGGDGTVPDGTTVSVVAKPWFVAESLTASSNLSSTAPQSTEPSDLHRYNTHRLDLVDSIFELCGKFSKSSSRRSYNTPEDANATLIEAKNKFSSQAESMRKELPTYDLAEALAEDIEGEVILAVSDGNNWERWGRHYFFSLARSHQRQQCGNFKDAGLQVYGKHSALFKSSRNLVDAAFDKLPPPKPSYKQANARPIQMSRYNMSRGPCFTGGSLVSLADGTTCRVDKITRGILVSTPRGPRPVMAILKTHITNGIAAICKVGGLQVTPWHPIHYQEKWCFPVEIIEPEWVECDAVYSFLLERNSDVESHVMNIGGINAVTLGHGLMNQPSEKCDVRNHPFFGSYDKVLENMVSLDGYHRVDGVTTCFGLTRGDDGLANGFLQEEQKQVKKLVEQESVAVEVAHVF